MRPDTSPRAREADRLLVEAERLYTQAAYARALAVIEELPPGNALNVFRRASVAHALAEMRGDTALLWQAIAEYERAAAAGLPRDIARFIPSLLAECREQLREGEGRA